MEVQTKRHELEPVSIPESKHRYRCKVCQQEWVTHPTSTCPGVRAFSSRDPKDCPEQYKTLEELEVKGLRPRNPNQPVGAYRSSKHGSWAFLYDETKATGAKSSVVNLRLLKHGFGFLAWLVNIVSGGIISILLGITPAPASPTTIPVISFLLQYPLASLIIICGSVLAILIGSLLFLRLTTDDSSQLLHRYIHPWSLVTATSTASFLACFALLVTVLVRPSWCPASLCPQITNPLGVHDANLDVYFLSFQSSAIVIPGDPAHASVTDVSNEKSSHTVNAVLLKNHVPSSIYRIVLVAHSLYQGRFSILIDKVALVVDDRPITPQPLNVWMRNPTEHFDVSRYGIIYHGEGNGAVIPARYLQSPNGFTELASNEADQLDVQISSSVPVDLKFKIQVTYHIATDPKTHTLQLPQIFEVVFSDSSNWHEYQLQGEHFVARP